jgi:hypothetical protein
VSSDVEPRVLLRSTLLANGMSDDELARLVRRRELFPLQRGAYLARPAADEDDRHRGLVAATVAGLRMPGTVSHVSAALLHGLPRWSVVHDRVHVIRSPPPPAAAAHGSTCTSHSSPWRRSPTSAGSRSPTPPGRWWTSRGPSRSSRASSRRTPPSPVA